VGAAWLFQPLVLDIAEEAGPEEGVGLLDVGEISGQERSFDFESAILIYGSGFSGRADNEELVAVANNLKTVGWICFVDPLAKEFRPGGSTAAEEHGAEQCDCDEAKDR
jgi:hypothetical protein